MIYFTADIHLGHQNILNHCADTRPFDSLEEMTEHFIWVWNTTVQPKDEVYVLGDLFFRADLSDVAHVLAQLEGRIYLLPGNHDEKYLPKVLTIFESNRIMGHHRKDTPTLLPALHHVSFAKRRYVLCHYPLETWDGDKRADIRDVQAGQRQSVHLHGHQHGKGTTRPWRYDVGWDATHRVVSSIEDIDHWISEAT